MPTALFFLGQSVSSTAEALDVKRLRVLVANQRQDRLAEVVDLIANLGHEVIAPQIEVTEVAGGDGA